MELSGRRSPVDLPPTLFELTRTEFKAVRAIRGLSLRAVARQTGLSNPFLSQFENGKTKDIGLSTYEILRKWISGSKK